jgi:hypothetical protein
MSQMRLPCSRQIEQGSSVADMDSAGGFPAGGECCHKGLYEGFVFRGGVEKILNCEC